ncbi:hypothetical protein GCM10020254_09610 [Streptomyces goshikiensis]
MRRAARSRSATSPPGQGVADGRAVADRDDDPGAPQHRQLLREVGGLDVDFGEEVPYRHGAVLQEFQDADADRVPEHAEELGLRLVQGYLHAHQRSRRRLLFRTRRREAGALADRPAVQPPVLIIASTGPTRAPA